MSISISSCEQNQLSFTHTQMEKLVHKRCHYLPKLKQGPRSFSVCFKCFRCSRGILQLFHMNDAKIDWDVAYVAKCSRGMLQVFQRHVASICSICFICFHTYVASVFMWMLHMFRTYAVRVCLKCFSCFNLILQ
jgi:hypothetical protein